MLSKIININIKDNILDSISNYICEKKELNNKKIAIISGGKRPFLFLKNRLNKKRTNLFLPYFFTSNDFIDKIITDNFSLVKIFPLEAAYIIFNIIRNDAEINLINNRKSFGEFLDWSFEILAFIEQMDLENVTNDKLKYIKANAEIGYNVPNNINSLLKNIFKIRKCFHKNLEQIKKTTRGYSFFKTANIIKTEDIVCNFDEIILMAPFYLYKTEISIFKKIYNINKLTIFVQGNPKDYNILSELYLYFEKKVPNIISEIEKFNYKLNIFSASDDQAQGALLRNILSKYSKEDINNTVIIVPNSKILKSVISEISIITENYNISIGYPICNTIVFSLLNAIFEAQLSRNGEYYYSKNIMNVLSNPIIKNMKFFNKKLGFVINEIEQLLSNSSYFNGRSFITCDEIINNMNLNKEKTEFYSKSKIKNKIFEVFNTFFISWEKIQNFNCLSKKIINFVKTIFSIEVVYNNLINNKTTKSILALAKKMITMNFTNEKLRNDEILNIFKKIIIDKKITIAGSPFKGIQILGLLESRNLTFNNVFIIGMSDSAIPAIKKEYSLIPKDIMYTLGIEMTKNKIEIQKYHFERLIAKAKNLNLIYPSNNTEERSRFIDSIIWKKQQELNKINVVNIKEFTYSYYPTLISSKREYKKTESILKYLSNISYTYSKIDTYLTCRLKFYFTYVLLLDNNLEVSKELSNKDIGNFIHSFLKNSLYKNLYVKNMQSLNFVKNYIRKLNNYFDKFSFFKAREDSYIIKRILRHKMLKLLYYDRLRFFFKIYTCETNYTTSIKILNRIYKLSCVIDRIDYNNSGDYTILDYKTGNVRNSFIAKKKFSILNTNINRQYIKNSINSLQLPLYKYIFEKNTNNKVAHLGIYDIKKTKIIKFPEEKTIYDKCIDIIKYVINEINSEGNFVFDKEDEISCRTCKYMNICR
ncbi:MAG: PD-(D/E)XK nuclease family protein [Endomicrobium sp.]|jgi:hypothetical protein|nr:PD-(D/E)XK nuclease family protein [Endomicrobium sp.]